MHQTIPFSGFLFSGFGLFRLALLVVVVLFLFSCFKRKRKSRSILALGIVALLVGVMLISSDEINHVNVMRANHAQSEARRNQAQSEARRDAVILRSAAPRTSPQHPVGATATSTEALQPPGSILRIQLKPGPIEQLGLDLEVVAQQVARVAQRALLGEGGRSNLVVIPFSELEAWPIAPETESNAESATEDAEFSESAGDVASNENPGGDTAPDEAADEETAATQAGSPEKEESHHMGEIARLTRVRSDSDSKLAPDVLVQIDFAEEKEAARGTTAGLIDALERSLVGLEGTRFVIDDHQIRVIRKAARTLENGAYVEAPNNGQNPPDSRDPARSTPIAPVELAVEPESAAAVAEAADPANVEAPTSPRPPDWVGQPSMLVDRAYRMIGTSEPYPTEQEAQQALSKLLDEMTRQYVSELLLNVSAEEVEALKIPRQYIRQQVLKETWVGPFEEQTFGDQYRAYGKYYALHAELDFDDEAREVLLGAWRRDVINQRLWYSGIGSLFVLGLLGTVFGYLKFDTATRGYYSGILIVGAGLFIVAILGAAAAWFFL